MSYWSFRKAGRTSPEVKELRDVVAMAMEQLREKEQMKARTRYTTGFQVSFYNFLKRLRDKEQIGPSEVLTVLLSHPELSNFIQRQKYADFLNALRQLSHTDANRQIIYVSLVYDYYYRYRSFIRAAVKAGHYRLDKFTCAFVHNVFTQYPFLHTKAHLDHVVSMLDTYAYACTLTEKGILENYHVKT